MDISAMANPSLSGLLGCTVQMAEREGYGALVVTVDAPRYKPAFFPTPPLGRRLRAMFGPPPACWCSDCLGTEFGTKNVLLN